MNASIKSPWDPLRACALALLLAGGVLGAFWNVWRADYVFYDDINYVKENPAVQAGLTQASAAWAFYSPQHKVWHPVTWLSFMLEVEFGGGRPVVHHTTNLVLHLLNVFLLWFFLSVSTKTVWRSFAVALLFAVHPMRVESVAWITERKDVLSLFFGLWGLITYTVWVRRKQAWVWWVTLFFFILAVMAKSMLVTFPFLLVLLDIWPLGRFSPRDLRPILKAALQEKGPFFVLSFLFCLVNVWAYRSGGGVLAMPETDLAMRLQNAVVVCLEYLCAFFWPVALTVFHPFEPVSAGRFLLALILLGGVTAGVAWRAAAHLPFAVGWFWYLGTLVPALGIFSFTWMRMGDRFTYLPHIGFLIFLIWGLAFFWERAGRFWRAGIVSGFVIGTVFLCLVSRQQVKTWMNSRELFAQALRVHPEFVKELNNTGNALAQEGRYGDAMDHFAGIVMVQPDFAPAYFNMGRTLEVMGRPEEARAMYAAVLEILPEHAASRKKLLELGKVADQVTDETAI